MRHRSAPLVPPALVLPALVLPAVRLFAALGLLAAAAPAAAQLVLPGAVAPTPEGAPAAAAPPSPGAARPKPHRRPADPASRPAAAPTSGSAAGSAAGSADKPSTATPAKVLPASALAGQTLYRDGRGSEISFEARDRGLVVTRMTLAGKAEDGADCRVDVADLPLPVRDEGQPDGMARIGIPVPACPISFDVLDGAALETGDRAACSFAATHCKVDPSGLWGPPAASLTPDRDKAIERQRTQAEAAVRAGYKRLMKTTKLRSALMDYAHEQAQFSSTREEMCRGYAAEVKHGFCATRVTEARAAALRVKADIGQAEKDARKHKRGSKGA